MAATLTDDGQLTAGSFTFPIEKIETTPDGDLMCYGRASDGSVDHDQQIVDTQFSSKALRDWLESGGNVRVQHNAQRDPAGVGLEVNTDADGATWVKSLIIEPVAKKLLAAGALRAYSVGIARPTIVRDAVAKGGRITDGSICEISLVDRPANARCGVQLVKSATDGTPEYVGEVFGAEADIAKALGADVTKAAPDGDDFVSVDLPRGASISISPADFARLRTFKQQLVTKTAGTAIETDTEKRDVSTAERRSLASEGNALPDGSYPIESTGDPHNAAHLARTGHGDAAAARRLIARRAEELGVANPLDESDKSDDVAKSETVTAEVTAPQTPAERLLHDIFAADKADAPDAEKAETPAGQAEAAPDVTKDPKPKPVKKAKKPKKMPPWLNKPKDGDGDSGSKGSDDDKDDDSSCKSVSDHLWTGIEGTSDIECSKCHTTPAQAAGVAGTHDMTCAPVPELMESDGPASTKGATPASASGAVAEHMNPVPRHREPDGAPMEAFEASSGMSDGDDEKPTRLEAATGMKAATAAADLAPDPEVAALLRFKATGTDEDLGRLHDLTCPAYHPEQVAKYHPYADLGSLIDAGAWMRKALTAAAGPLEAAREMQETWQAANLLKAADSADLNQWRLELHKAFRDANPGPGSYPTPGCVSPQPYNRPVLSDGRAANGVDYDAPNSSPQVATSAPNAQNFDRPPLDAGHQSPSPSFMKASFEYPSEQGRPTQLNYAAMEKEQARQALVRMHHHLARQFPEACPITLDTTPAQQENHPVPTPAGIGKAAAEPNAAMTGPDAETERGRSLPARPEDAVVKATPEGADLFADADVYKGFKKMRKKLGKKVLAGKMTVDEARARMGRQFAQKGAEPVIEQVQKGDFALDEVRAPVVYTAQGPMSMPDAAKLIAAKAADAATPVAAAFSPEDIEAAVTKAVAPLLEKIREQDETFTTKLAEQQRVIDAIADQPDPGTAAFSGLAFQPAIQKSRRPAAVPDQAEYAARAQEMVRRNLTHTYQTHSDPHVREAASSALANLGVGMEAPPMT